MGRLQNIFLRMMMKLQSLPLSVQHVCFFISVYKLACTHFNLSLEYLLQSITDNQITLVINTQTNVKKSLSYQGLGKCEEITLSFLSFRWSLVRFYSLSRGFFSLEGPLGHTLGCFMCNTFVIKHCFLVCLTFLSIIWLSSIKREGVPILLLFPKTSKA